MKPALTYAPAVVPPRADTAFCCPLSRVLSICRCIADAIAQRAGRPPDGAWKFPQQNPRSPRDCMVIEAPGCTPEAMQKRPRRSTIPDGIPLSSTTQAPQTRSMRTFQMPQAPGARPPCRADAATLRPWAENLRLSRANRALWKVYLLTYSPAKGM